MKSRILGRNPGRRQVLKAAAGCALVGPGTFFGAPRLAYGDAGCAAFGETSDGRPLKALARDRNLLFGTAADRDLLAEDQDYAKAVISECAMITPENSMKWERLRPTPETFSFDNADWLMDFAEANGIAFHGHTLVWHLQMPGWFEDVVTKRNAERYLADHIQTVAGRYAGRLRSWDVVNEAINPDYGRVDGLTVTPWLERLGPEYIPLAFRMAAEADPGAVLVYNDYGLEYEGDYFEARRQSLIDLLAGLVLDKTPIHALGVQSHLDGHLQPDFKRFARFLDDVAALGLDIMITELDVRDNDLPADIAKRDCAIAETYEAYLDVVLANPNVRSIAVWGLSDRYSWLSYFNPRDDGTPVRPLPLDADLKRKPAWNAISRALSG